MTRPRLLPRLVVAIVATVALATPTARADEAEDLNTAGKIQYGRGELEEALGSFRAAFRATPRPKYLVNVARTLDKLGRPAEAADAWRAYLPAAEGAEAQTARAELVRLCAAAGRAVLHVEASEPGAAIRLNGAPLEGPPLLCLPPGEARLAATAGPLVAEQAVPLRAGQEHAARLALAPAPGRLAVRAAGPARVSVDGRDVGEAPVQVPVASGAPHRVDVTASGRPPWSVTVTPAAGETLELEAWAEAVEPPADEVQWGWVTLGASAAAVVAGGVLYGVAYDKYATANDLDPRVAGYDAAFDDLIAEGEGLQIGAYVSFGIGAALLVPTFILLLDEDDPPAPALRGTPSGFAFTF